MTLRHLPAALILAAVLATTGSTLAQPEIEGQVREALAQYQAGRYAEARARFDAVLPSVTDPEARANLAFNAAVCSFELGDWQDAERRFTAVAAQSPATAGEAELSAGFAALRAGRIAAARQHLDRAGSSQPGHADLAAQIEAAERGARPAPRLPRAMPQPGLAGSVGVAGGYDSNAAQSGTSDATGTAGVSSSAASPTLGASGELAYAVSLGDRVRLRPAYLVDGLWLTSSQVSDLSLLNHHGLLELCWAPGSRWLLRPQVGGGYSSSGSKTTDPFAADLLVGLKIDWDHAERASARLRLESRPVWGLGEYEYLTGSRWLVALSERWYGPSTRFGVEGSLRYVDQGELSIVATDGSGTFTVPLSYVAPALRLDLDLDLLDRLTLGTRAGAELRSYLSDSSMAGVAGSRQSRRDLRLGGGAEIEILLGPEEEGSLLIGYDVLVSVSTMGGKGRQASTYEDRNFVQHVAELGAEIRF